MYKAVSLLKVAHMYVIFADIALLIALLSLCPSLLTSVFILHTEKQNNEQWIRGLALTEIVYDLNIVTAVVSQGCLE